MHPVDREVCQQLQAKEKKDREDQQRQGESTDGDPRLTAADVDWHMFLEAAAPLLQSDHHQDPHDECGDQKDDRHRVGEMRDTAGRWSVGIGRRLQRGAALEEQDRQRQNEFTKTTHGIPFSMRMRVLSTGEVDIRARNFLFHMRGWGLRLKRSVQRL
jgi:hypothetical protein